MKLKRVTLWGLGVAMILMAMAAIVASAIRSQSREEENRQQEVDQNRANEHYALALRLQDPCRKAIEQSIAPLLVLNWQTTSTSLTDWKDVESFSETTTGYKMKLFPDIGGKSRGYLCYLDKSARVLQIVEGVY